MPVWSLRLIPALAGSLCVPLCYLLVVELGYSHLTALGAALLFLMGNVVLYFLLYSQSCIWICILYFWLHCCSLFAISIECSKMNYVFSVFVKQRIPWLFSPASCCWNLCLSSSCCSLSYPTSDFTMHKAGECCNSSVPTRKGLSFHDHQHILTHTNANHVHWRLAEMYPTSLILVDVSCPLSVLSACVCQLMFLFVLFSSPVRLAWLVLTGVTCACAVGLVQSATF